MSLKVKLTSTIAAFLLILGLTIMGVFAAPTATVLLGGTISFKATDVHARVSGTITGSQEAEAETSKELALETLEFSSGKETDVSSWADTDITFQDSGAMVTIKIVIENLATDRMLYASVTDSIGTINNVTKTMKQLSSLSDATGTDYTGDVLSIPANSGNGTNVAYIQLTLQVTNPNASLDADASYGYQIDLNNEEPKVEEILDVSEYTNLGFDYLSEADNTVYVYGTNSPTGDIVIPSNVIYNGDICIVTQIGDNTNPGSSRVGFYNTSISSFKIPNTVISIGSYAFYGCSGLTSITIGNSVISIGNFAFNGCSGFTGELIIPDSVMAIGEDAFNGCSGLTSITIGNGVTSIGMSAFQSCSGLTGELVIPDSVTSIGAFAFSGCSSLTTITIEATTPPTLVYTGAIPDNVTEIRVPSASLSAYQSATNWSSFASKMVGF